MKDFISEINGCVVATTGLWCWEYVCKLTVNPWQDLIFEKNKHHLLAILAALCNGCGGVVYLMEDKVDNTDGEGMNEEVERTLGEEQGYQEEEMGVVEEGQTLENETFQRFQHRLMSLINREFKFPLPLRVTHVSLKLGQHRSWAIIGLKKASRTLSYPSLKGNGEWQPTHFQIDVYGRIHARNATVPKDQYSNVTDEPCVSECTDVGSSQDNATEAVEDTVVKNAAQPTEIKRPLSSQDDDYTLVGYEPEPPIVNFSSVHRLAWSENKKDWEKYVNAQESTLENIVASCPMLEPTQPMRVTPGVDSLQCIFGSTEDMEQTLSIVKTNQAGFAIVSKTWGFDILDNNKVKPPNGHICDILTITVSGEVCFWVIAEGSDNSNFCQLKEYLMIAGRMLKYQFVMKDPSGSLSNLRIHCRLLLLRALDVIVEAIRITLHRAEGVEDYVSRFHQNKGKLEALQKTLAKVILSRESPLKHSVADHISITLSAQQVELLMHKAKVNYVSGPAGSGKSFTASCIYKKYGKDKSVYICTTKAFAEYLNFNNCIGTLVQGDEDLAREIQNGTFENKTCIIIDDCHNFQCTRSSLKKLFILLKENREMSLFVFGDNEYQSFDRERQRNIHDSILDLTRQVLKQCPVDVRLTTIYRNTRKVVSFLQSAIEDIYDGHQEISCANTENGDGVECMTMTNMWIDSPENGLALYLRSLGITEAYNPTEIAILLDSEYTQCHVADCRNILARQISNVVTHGADVFPRTGIVVDFVDSFLGLDTLVCVFILSNTHKKATQEGPLASLKKVFFSWNTEPKRSIYNPRYEVFLASRAIHKAVFVVPEIHSDLVQQMKFDQFQVCNIMEKNF